MSRSALHPIHYFLLYASCPLYWYMPTFPFSTKPVMFSENHFHFNASPERTCTTCRQYQQPHIHTVNKQNNQIYWVPTFLTQFVTRQVTAFCPFLGTAWNFLPVSDFERSVSSSTTEQEPGCMLRTVSHDFESTRRADGVPLSASLSWKGASCSRRWKRGKKQKKNNEYSNRSDGNSSSTCALDHLHYDRPFWI